MASFFLFFLLQSHNEKENIETVNHSYCTYVVSIYMLIRLDSRSF